MERIKDKLIEVNLMVVSERYTLIGIKKLEKFIQLTDSTDCILKYQDKKEKIYYAFIDDKCLIYVEKKRGGKK